jgi:hypothetical protein
MNRAARWIFASCVAAAAACGPSTPPPQSPPSANVTAANSGGATCDSAVGHLIDMMSADKQDVPPDTVKKFHDMFVAHCQSDAWSPQLLQCLNGMKALPDADHCESLMTDAQKQSLDSAMGPATGGAQPSSTESAPPPPPAPAATTPPASRSGTPKPGKSGDPCDGGN